MSEESKKTDALKNLMAGTVGGKAPMKKPARKKTVEPATVRKYKNIYMDEKAIELLNKVTYGKKALNPKYTIGDAVHDGLKLLAKKEGIEP